MPPLPKYYFQITNSISHLLNQTNCYFYDTNIPKTRFQLFKTNFTNQAPMLYLQTRQLRGNDTMIPFAGSDFWLCDLGLEFFHWPEQKVLKKEFHRQCACTVLESTNPNPAPGSYSRVVCWIDNDSLGIVEAYAYDANNRKLKNFYPKNFEKVNGQYQLESMVMENLQTGSKSVMEFDLDK